MKTPAFLALLLFAFTLFAAEDVRSRVADGGTKSALSSVIDPDKSIYGIPFGTSEDEFIAKCGKPTGYLRLSGAQTAMIYGQSHAFVFEDGKLLGLRISDGIVDWKLSRKLPANTVFDGMEWQLSNGIKKNMDLLQVKNILGDKLSNNRYSRSYQTEKAQVELDFSHWTNMGETDLAYRLMGFYIKQGAAEPDPFFSVPDFGLNNPGLGSTGILLDCNTNLALPLISEVVTGSDADKAGVRANTVILAVNGIPTKGKSPEEWIPMLERIDENHRGTLILDLMDPATQATNRVTIQRSTFLLGASNVPIEAGTIGVVIAPDFSSGLPQPLIVGVFSNGPAAKSGVQPGSIILSVDGKPIQGKSATDWAKQLRGESGSTVKLELSHFITKATSQVTIQRK